MVFERRESLVVFVAIQLIISEPAHALLSMNLLLQMAKLRHLHFTK